MLIAGSALYGGLQQQDPDDPRSIMERLRKRAKAGENICYMGQYDNDHVGSVDATSVIQS